MRLPLIFISFAVVLFMILGSNFAAAQVSNPGGMLTEQELKENFKKQESEPYDNKSGTYPQPKKSEPAELVQPRPVQTQPVGPRPEQPMPVQTRPVQSSSEQAYVNNRPESYTDSQIRYQARALAERLRISRGKVDDLLINLDYGFQDAWYKRVTSYRKVKGVFVFEAGRGGIIVKYMEGDGLVSFINGRQGSPFRVKSWSIGAQLGGGAVYGVGLVMDIKYVDAFGGDYDGKTQTATAGDMTTSNWVVLKNTGDPHDIFILQTSRGLSAGVALERITISPRW